MIKIKEKTECNGCSSCINICPTKCISMKYDSEGFLYPEIDKKTCVECGLCEKTCPVINTDQSISFSSPEAYAVINNNAEIRNESSSGGVFTLIAEWVIEKKGVVFGAAFDNDLKVNHICVKSKDEFYRLRGSKYLQSQIGKVYKDVKHYLENGRYVLFTGTPCQIGGLKSYLGKDYNNLICQDIICHGVPSPAVWKKYLNYREKKNKAKVTKVYFRNKNQGWKMFSIRCEFENNTIYNQTLNNDLFMKAFLSDLCLRPSCYDCKFKTLNRQADITLADFWGIDKVLPAMDDDKGTSLVIVHSENGRKIFEDILKNTKYSKVDINKALKYNPAMIEPAKKPSRRDRFMKDVFKISFEKAVVRNLPKQSFVKRAVNKAKRILKTIIHKGAI